MLLFALGFVGFGIAAMDEDGDVARDYLLLAIAVTLLMIGFVGLVMVQ